MIDDPEQLALFTPAEEVYGPDDPAYLGPAAHGFDAGYRGAARVCPPEIAALATRGGLSARKTWETGHSLGGEIARLGRAGAQPGERAA